MTPKARPAKRAAVRSEQDQPAGRTDHQQRGEPSISDDELEQAWIAAQVSRMPTPSRHDAEVWAVLLDIRSLFNKERAKGRDEPTQEHAAEAAISEPAAEQSGVHSAPVPPPSAPPATPWMTVSEVATYVGIHRETLYCALHEFESTRGRKGLRGYQQNASCKWRIQRDDVNAWIRGEKPGRTRTAP
jgi:excisionase family DNA binding protein